MHITVVHSLQDSCPDTQTVASEESLVFGTRERDRGASGACYSVQSTCYKCSGQAAPPPHADCIGGRGGDRGIFLSFSWA